MIKQIFWLLFITANFNSFSQTFSNKKTDLQNSELKGPVESIKETKYSTRQFKGKSVKDTITENPKLLHYSREGYLTEEITYELNGTISEKWNYTYDTKNNRLEGKRYNNDGNLLWNYISKFDNAGNEVEITKYEEGSLVETSTLKYDSKGNCVEINSESEGIWKETNIYDNRGNKVEYIAYNPEGKITNHETYRFDSKGKKADKVKYDAEGSIIGKETYNYDTNGNLSEYKYFSGGGNLLEKNVYSYDSKGNKTEHAFFRADGSLAWKLNYHYIFDKSGNWILKTEMVNGKAKYITERQIRYF